MAVPPGPASDAAGNGVYSAAPSISKDAVLKRAAVDAEAGEAPDAKRAKGGVVESPAMLRASAARAEGAGATSTWTFGQDGELVRPGAEAATQPAAAAGPAAGAQGEAPVQPRPPPGAPPPGPPLPPGWVRVPHEDDFYYWNTVTQEVVWEHPAEQKKEEAVQEKKPVFTETHRVLWTDLGRIIGRQGICLKIIKASIGCSINIPRQGKGGGKGDKGDKGGKGKKGKDKSKEVRRGIGDGTEKLKDEEFATVTITADTAYKAKGGKRTIEVMLGYNRDVERALAELGVDVVMPSLDEMTDGAATKASKDGLDPMDPASYSDAPVGKWSAGMKKPKAGGGEGGKGGKGGGKGGKGGGGAPPMDSKTANAERC